MGENQGVIWVLVGALVLGVAIFAMGKLFADGADANATKMAFQSQLSIDEASAACVDPKVWTPITLDDTWTPGAPTGTCAVVTP